MASCLVMQLLIPAAVMFIATTVQAQDDSSGTQFIVQCFLLPIAVVTSPHGCDIAVYSLAILHLKFDAHL